MVSNDVAHDALRTQTETDFKPAMDAQRIHEPAPAVSATQGLRPVDPRKTPPAKRPIPTVRTALGQVLGIRLTPDLRARVAEAAIAAGASDSAWLRQVALEALGVESPVDAASGRRVRVAPEDQAALAACVRDLGEATLAIQSSRSGEAVEALERMRRVIIPIVLGFERRPS
ncbi:hypothetical protein [Methylobacterium sp. Leaf88]|uniref:hypothetical protein n=1 Tax=Methylobacterium sp. Leaf88 TaxID=1736244 RepID=UPI0006F21233|nr:hypothetical protein [Methylobacterium sp. Leaf88]KQO61747.1 hypothetical protein ASF20_09765 [Methylobacterium sp. Leaf88]